MMGGILVTVLAAVSNDEWEAMRSDIADIRDVVYDIKGSVALHEFRLNDITAEQAQFVRDCRANHAVLAPPIKEAGSTKTQAAIGVGMLFGAIAIIGKGTIAALGWLFTIAGWVMEHFKVSAK
jgi:hypothetical protein